MGVSILKPYSGSRRTGFLLLVRQTIPRCTDAISWYVHGDHSANVSYKYEGVLKVIRRSRETLIFAMGVLII